MLTRRTPLRATGRDTGPNGATRVQVFIRDESRCVRCGDVLVLGSIHHRLPRGRGGTNRLSNLILLCGTGTTSCHGWVESHRAEAYRLGYLVRTTDDPATVPVWYCGTDPVLLDNSGQWREA